MQDPVANRRVQSGEARYHFRVVAALLIAISSVALLWAVIHARKAEAISPETGVLEGKATEDFSPVFKPTRQTFKQSFREYFQLQSTPVQPIAFQHRVHLKNGMQCTSCHPGVTEGPDAGIQSVTFCMACHQEVAADKPEIKKLAAYAAKGQDIPWRPVYWFYSAEHLRFWHAPHIRAGIDCQQCHADMTQQSVAVRSKNMNMNYCITCHKAKAASTDCTTCHY